MWAFIFHLYIHTFLTKIFIELLIHARYYAEFHLGKNKLKQIYIP